MHLTCLLFVTFSVPAHQNLTDEADIMRDSVTDIAKPLLNWSDKELNYLSATSELKYCIDPQWMPIEKAHKGEHIGITADYIRLFSEALGIPVRYVPTASWPESLDKARSRECDILTAATRTEEREGYLNFTKALHSSHLILATETHQPKVEDIGQLSGVKVGLVKGYAFNKSVKNQFSNLEYVEVSNIQEGLTRVVSGELFGFIGVLSTVGYEIQQNHYGELKINNTLIHHWEIGMAARNDHPQLVTILNKLIASISVAQRQQILRRWLSIAVTDEESNELTVSERLFLQRYPEVRFRIKPNRPPFDFVVDGEAQGIAVDYMKKIAEITGMKAKFVVHDSNPLEAYQIMEQPRSERIFDAMLYSVYNEKRAKRIKFGDAYLSYPMMGFVHKNAPHISDLNDMAGKTVALERGFLTNEWIRRDYPKINIINTSSTFKALELVERGTVDAYVGNLAIANYLFSNARLSDVKIGFATKYKNIDYRFVAPNDSKELVSILSKGYRQISAKEHSSIQQKWFSLQTIERTDYTLVWQVGLVLMAALAGVFIWNRALSAEKSKTDEVLAELRKAQADLQEKNELLQKLSVTDKLTGLFNRAKLETVLEQETNRSLRYTNHKFGIILIDVDYFKSINDSFGHQVGDRFLQELSSLFSDNLRKVDTLGRWGGEEFLIVIPNTDKQGLITVAENLRARVEATDFTVAGRRTSSFGLALFREKDTIESMLIRADKALYQSKGDGRNKVTFL
ncbi:transporter substrate-binding domain-containing protein [Vibrio sp. JC009]|uniref:diguanylate cyclase n=1 Tax=Vibrio sp. JC009 TaxID=2912314 RepID=UPI0023B11A59|nr:transporter substrate-binding domain-containing protein [Vibrio sp. JC009]WED24452.1 transporter substrate-binding domain-containing protein [Vibrio sp. JC009]